MGGFFTNCVDLRAVARGKDDDFSQSVSIAQRCQRLGNASSRKIDLFAEVDWRAVMADAEKKETHLMAQDVG